MQKHNATHLSRRQFLQRSGAVIGGLVLGTMAGCQSPAATSETPTLSLPPDVIYSPDTLRQNRIPPGQHQLTEWPVLQAGGVQDIAKSDWSLHLFGLVSNEITLSFNDFTALPDVDVYSDIHCVTRWSLLGNLWHGVSTTTLAGVAGVMPQAKYVISHAAAGFTTNAPIETFLQDDVLLAIDHDYQPLTAEHGGPVRVVIPRLYFWKSAKWITGLEFTAEDHPGFWENLGYNNNANPWLEQRYS
jgi:DMSO/TMAO reductase YedYZ molybdopterin-dependent catalytic subunit